jgi:hypothetical protein
MFVGHEADYQARQNQEPESQPKPKAPSIDGTAWRQLFHSKNSTEVEELTAAIPV